VWRMMRDMGPEALPRARGCYAKTAETRDANRAAAAADRDRANFNHVRNPGRATGYLPGTLYDSHRRRGVLQLPASHRIGWQSGIFPMLQHRSDGIHPHVPGFHRRLLRQSLLAGGRRNPTCLDNRQAGERRYVLGNDLFCAAAMEQPRRPSHDQPGDYGTLANRADSVRQVGMYDYNVVHRQL